MGSVRWGCVMSRYIDADEAIKVMACEMYAEAQSQGYDVDGVEDFIPEATAWLNDASSIDLADYVPKDFHDKTCEAMAKRHQEEIADMVSVVRCKDCRHWKWIEWAKEYRCTVRNTAFNARADDYCSYGEREGE